MYQIHEQRSYLRFRAWEKPIANVTVYSRARCRCTRSRFAPVRGVGATSIWRDRDGAFLWTFRRSLGLRVAELTRRRQTLGLWTARPRANRAGEPPGKLRWRPLQQQRRETGSRRKGSLRTSRANSGKSKKSRKCSRMLYNLLESTRML